MRPSTSNPNQIAAWQLERARKVHRACLRLEQALASGEPLARAARRIARNFTGRIFKSRPTRRMALCAGSLHRLFKIWQRGGRLPAALVITYSSGRRAGIPASVLVRFTDFCARKQHANLKRAWQAFCARNGNFGRGRRSGKPLKISYGMVRYHFRAAGFYGLQACLKTMEEARTDLSARRFAIIADLRRRLPDRPPCPAQPEYEI